ncbi:MAG: hypothetical protein ABSF54_15515 [Bryobacteraceae bacterium]|jgi:hypothetical protein
MTAALSSFHATKKSAAGWSLGCRLGDWDEEIGTEYRQKLANVRKENLHILPIGLWKLRSTGLVLIKRKPARLGGLLQELALEISHMSLGEVFVLADEDDSRDPELLGLVLLKAFANNLGLADVSEW